jgi:hypothetical protein
MKILFCILGLLFSLTAFSQTTVNKDEVQSALDHINETRKLAGLDSVVLSKTLSDGCYKHAQYLVINKDNALTSGMNAHKEFPKLKGYSKEGESAGAKAVIHYVKPSVAIEGFVKTLYHRIPLLQPELREVGIGYFEKDGYIVTLVECISGMTGKLTTEVVLFPNENQMNVPLIMGPEIPDPVGVEGEHGYPVTIYFANWQEVKNVTFKLTGSDGKVVECFVSSPEKPATDFSQWNTICAIAKKPLLPETKFTVSISCTVNGSPFKKT